jgi:hypothetical protein
MMIAIGALLWVIAAAGDAAHGVMMFPMGNALLLIGFVG